MLTEEEILHRNSQLDNELNRRITFFEERFARPFQSSSNASGQINAMARSIYNQAKTSFEVIKTLKNGDVFDFPPNLIDYRVYFEFKQRVIDFLTTLANGHTSDKEYDQSNAKLMEIIKHYEKLVTDFRTNYRM